VARLAPGAPMPGSPSPLFVTRAPSRHLVSRPSAPPRKRRERDPLPRDRAPNRRPAAERGPEKRARASGARATIDEVGVGGGGYPQPMVIGTLLARRSPKLTPAPSEPPTANTLDDAYATLHDSEAVSVVAAYDPDIGSKAPPPELFVGTASLSFGAGLLSLGIGRGRRPGLETGPERMAAAMDAAVRRQPRGMHGRSALLFAARHSPPIFLDFISFSIGLGSTV
jgi:hypothetical protein